MKIDYKPYASLATATALAQLFVLLLSPIVTRLYSQEQFGTFGLIFAVGTFLGAIAPGRLELAIPVAKSSLDAIRRFALGTTFALALSLLLAACAAIVWATASPVPFLASGAPLAAIPLICFVLAIFQLSGAMLLWHKDYRSFALSKVTQGICIGVLQVAMGLAAFGGAGLVLAQAGGYAAAVVVGLRRLARDAVHEITQNGALLRQTWEECWRFPLVMMPAAIFNQASQQLPLLAITHLFGLAETGLFAFTYRICTAPLGLVSQSVSQVYASDFRNLRTDSAVLRSHFKAMLIRLFSVGAVLVLAIVAGLSIADWLGIFGREWSHLGQLALFIMPSMLMDFVATPLSATLGYLERQRLQLYWDVGRFLSIFLVFGMAGIAGWAFLPTVLLYSVTWAAGLLIHLILVYKVTLSLRHTE